LPTEIPITIKAMAKIDDFKTELKTLLDKYNASIACNIDVILLYNNHNGS
jgi:hypothetical protein